jgi:hypothetical protein
VNLTGPDPSHDTDIDVSYCLSFVAFREKSMVHDLVEADDLARGATLGQLRQDLLRCIARAEALGLTAIAIYLQRAFDEIANISA